MTVLRWTGRPQAALLRVVFDDIARWASAEAKVAHLALPPWRASEYVSTGEPGSVAFAFVGLEAAVVELGGRGAQERRIPPASIGLCGPEPIDWLVVQRPSDSLEIVAASALRAEIATALGVAQHAELDDLYGWSDPVLLAIARRLRAGLRGWDHVSELERDGLVRAAYARALVCRFGGKEARLGALDDGRLRRVTEFVETHLERDVTVRELAHTAALSPFHFARAFRVTTGLTPHAYVVQRRLTRAAERLQAGAVTVERAAQDAGFTSLRHFRRLFRRQFGVNPSAVRQSAGLDPVGGPAC